MRSLRGSLLLMKVGLLLGSFDPFHIGHISAANQGLKAGVDEVWIIPAPKNPWKTVDPVKVSERINMIKLGLVREDKRIKPVRVDIAPDSDGKYFSYKQLQSLKEKYPEVEFLIIGGPEVAGNIKDWKNGDWILKEFGVLEIFRPGFSAETQGTKISSTDIREALKVLYSGLGREELRYIIGNGLYK